MSSIDEQIEQLTEERALLLKSAEEARKEIRKNTIVRDSADRRVGPLWEQISKLKEEKERREASKTVGQRMAEEMVGLSDMLHGGVNIVWRGHGKTVMPWPNETADRLLVRLRETIAAAIDKAVADHDGGLRNRIAGTVAGIKESPLGDQNNPLVPWHEVHLAIRDTK